MKLSAWAKSQGISYLTADRWYRAGTMPVRCWQKPSKQSSLVSKAPAASARRVVVIGDAEMKEDLVEDMRS